MLDLGVMSGAIGPATTGAGLGEGAVGGCPEDGGWVGMEAGSGRGVIIGLGFNGSLAMCWTEIVINGASRWLYVHRDAQ